MSNRMFQNVILQMKEATNRQIGVIDSEGCVIACTDIAVIGEKWAELAIRISSSSESLITFDKKTFKALTTGNAAYFDYAVYVSGDDEAARSLCLMAYVAINSAKIYYEEKHDKSTFVKNIIMDNILPGDIYIRAKELHFATDVQRAVLLVRQNSRADIAAVDVLQGMFTDRQQDFVISINESDIAVVKQITPNGEDLDLVKLAQNIEDTLRTELFIKTTIGIGTISNHLRELADSYKEAQVAIEVGKIFETEKSILSYENLGIGRLIYQLPTTLCEIFLSEIFKKNSIDSLDQETLFTINKFFENNLNVSETSRKLFVHRNTLVYRLEKIKKLTGLDLREFDHAIVFKVALMVKKYLNSRDNRPLPKRSRHRRSSMIEFQNVTKTYDNGTEAIRGIDLKIEDGEFVFLVGPSGSGKSTIINLLTAELTPTSGSIHINGFELEGIKKKQIPYLRRTVGVIFQDFRLIEKKTVYQNVAFAMRVIGAPEREIRKRVPYVLDLVGLGEKSKSYPDELSGGEQQRVAVARALINNPAMIVADEPTGNLDPGKSLEIMLLLEQINALGTTVLVVTHEADMVDRFHKRVIAINEGKVISDGMDGYFNYEEQ